MDTTTDLRYRIERIGLLLLGIIALYIGASFSAGLWPMGVTLGIAAVVAALVEVASVGRTGRRHLVASWLPVVVGMIALATITIALEEKGPDSGLALSIVVFAFLIAIPVFALLVNLIVAIVLRLRR